jgi:two-component system LytT family response regulator
MKVLVIDDEKPARDLLKVFLKDIKGIELTGEAENGFDGLKKIQDTKPDAIILDIQMPKLTGFEMLEILDDQPLVIFTTAYDQYAIKAFELNAVDYLLKPFSKDRFEQAMEKARGQLAEPPDQKKKISKVKEDYQKPGESLQRVVIKSGAKIKVIPVDKIRYITAEDDYVMIHAEDSKYLKQETMKFYETHLDPGEFARVHRSRIVKINQISQLELYGKDTYMATLKNGEKVKVSYNGYKNLKEKLKF